MMEMRDAEVYTRYVTLGARGRWLWLLWNKVRESRATYP
jgi:hypothetical protein